MSDRAPGGFFDGFFDRTFANLRRAWREIAGSARGVLSAALRPDLPDDDVARLRLQMQSCLDPRAGEVTARARTAELGRTYLALSPAGRERFMRLLASEFDTDHEAVARQCARLAGAVPAEERMAAERELRAALLPPRMTLLRQFNALPEGSSFSSTAAPSSPISARATRSCAPSTKTCASCSPTGSTSAFSNCAGSPGRRRRRCSKS